MYAEMDNQCCLWLDSIINDKVTSKSNQRDLLVFKALLQEHPNELEECRGKYVAVDRGKLLPFWFHQPGDACEADMQVTYFFFVPTVDKFCSSASMFKQSTHTITVKKMGTTTNEENVYHCPQVNLKLTNRLRWRADLLGLIVLLFIMRILTRETNSVVLCNKAAGFLW